MKTTLKVLILVSVLPLLSNPCEDFSDIEPPFELNEKSEPVFIHQSTITDSMFKEIICNQGWVYKYGSRIVFDEDHKIKDEEGLKNYTPLQFYFSEDSLTVFSYEQNGNYYSNYNYTYDSHENRVLTDALPYMVICNLDNYSDNRELRILLKSGNEYLDCYYRLMRDYELNSYWNGFTKK